MRHPHFSIKRTAPNEWTVFVVVDDGRWRVCTEPTASRAAAVALEKLAARRPVELEPTA